MVSADTHNCRVKVQMITFARTGSPWGAGTFAGSDGSRQPSALELEIATVQGKTFYEQVKRVKF